MNTALLVIFVLVAASLAGEKRQVFSGEFCTSLL